MAFNWNPSIVSVLFKIWSDGSMIFSIMYWWWICQTQKTKLDETKTFWDREFVEVSRPRLYETRKFWGCRDRDHLRLSKRCWDRVFFESLVNLCNNGPRCWYVEQVWYEQVKCFRIAESKGRFNLICSFVQDSIRHLINASYVFNFL